MPIFDPAVFDGTVFASGGFGSLTSDAVFFGQPVKTMTADAEISVFFVTGSFTSDSTVSGTVIGQASADAVLHVITAYSIASDGLVRKTTAGATRTLLFSDDFNRTHTPGPGGDWAWVPNDSNSGDPETPSVYTDGDRLVILATIAEGQTFESYAISSVQTPLAGMALFDFHVPPDQQAVYGWLLGNGRILIETSGIISQNSGPDIPVSLVADTWYRARFEWDGTTVRVRVWKTTDAEPSGWDYDQPQAWARSDLNPHPILDLYYSPQAPTLGLIDNVEIWTNDLTAGAVIKKTVVTGGSNVRPVLVNKTTNTKPWNGGTRMWLDRPTGTAAGDLLMAWIAGDPQSTPRDIEPEDAGWTLVKKIQPVSTDYQCLWLYTRVAASTDPTYWYFRWAAPNETYQGAFVGAMTAIRGVNPASFESVDVRSGTRGRTSTSGSLTLSGNSIYGMTEVGNSSSSSTWTQGTILTEDFDVYVQYVDLSGGHAWAFESPSVFGPKTATNSNTGMMMTPLNTFWAMRAWLSGVLAAATVFAQPVKTFTASAETVIQIWYGSLTGLATVHATQERSFTAKAHTPLTTASLFAADAQITGVTWRFQTSAGATVFGHPVGTCKADAAIVAIRPPRIAIWVDGIEYAEHVVSSSTSFSTKVNGSIGDATITILDRAHAFTFRFGMEVVLMIDGVARWGGWVVRPQMTFALSVIPSPATQPRTWVLECVDYNVILDKRIVHDSGKPDREWNYAPGTWDDTVIKDVWKYVDMDGFGEQIDRVAAAVLDIEGVTSKSNGGKVAAGGDTLRDVLAAISRNTAAIYYITPDKQVVYRDSETRSVPYVLTDQPAGVNDIAYREVRITDDITSMVNESFVWGMGYGSQNVAFGHREATSSIDQYGLWQVGARVMGVYKKATAEALADSYVDGSPEANRGAKNPKHSIAAATFDPRLNVGDVVRFVNTPWGEDRTLPVRGVTITFPTPENPRFALHLSWEIDAAWSMSDPWIPPEDAPLPSGDDGGEKDPPIPDPTMLERSVFEVVDTQSPTAATSDRLIIDNNYFLWEGRPVWESFNRPNEYGWGRTTDRENDWDKFVDGPSGSEWRIYNAQGRLNLAPLSFMGGGIPSRIGALAGPNENQWGYSPVMTLLTQWTPWYAPNTPDAREYAHALAIVDQESDYVLWWIRWEWNETGYATVSSGGGGDPDDPGGGGGGEVVVIPPTVWPPILPGESQDVRVDIDLSDPKRPKVKIIKDPDDEGGGSEIDSQSVIIDSFTRTMGSGVVPGHDPAGTWGTSDIGVPWNFSYPDAFMSVDGNHGVIITGWDSEWWFHQSAGFNLGEDTDPSLPSFQKATSSSFRFYIGDMVDNPDPDIPNEHNTYDTTLWVQNEASDTPSFGGNYIGYQMYLNWDDGYGYDVNHIRTRSTDIAIVYRWWTKNAIEQYDFDWTTTDGPAIPQDIPFWADHWFTVDWSFVEGIGLTFTLTRDGDSAPIISKFDAWPAGELVPVTGGSWIYGSVDHSGLWWPNNFLSYKFDDFKYTWFGGITDTFNRTLAPYEGSYSQAQGGWGMSEAGIRWGGSSWAVFVDGSDGVMGIYDPATGLPSWAIDPVTVVWGQRTILNWGTDISPMDITWEMFFTRPLAGGDTYGQYTGNGEEAAFFFGDGPPYGQGKWVVSILGQLGGCVVYGYLWNDEYQQSEPIQFPVDETSPFKMRITGAGAGQPYNVYIWQSDAQQPVLPSFSLTGVTWSNHGMTIEFSSGNYAIQSPIELHVMSVNVAGLQGTSQTDPDGVPDGGDGDSTGETVCESLVPLDLPFQPPVGDTHYLAGSRWRTSTASYMPGSTSFTINGIVQTGYAETDPGRGIITVSEYVYMTDALAMCYLTDGPRR